MVRALGLLLAAISLAAFACGGESSEDARGTPAAMPGATATVPNDLAEFSATLERTACFGFCPVYKVTVRGDGSVVFEGGAYSRGPRREPVCPSECRATIPHEDVRRLVDKIDEFDYFSLAVPTVASPWTCSATDAAGYETTVSLRGQERRIARCASHHPDLIASDVLTIIEDLIDEVAGTERWIGDRGLSGGAPATPR